MLPYVLAGLALGSIYAIASVEPGRHVRFGRSPELRLRVDGLLRGPLLLLAQLAARLGNRHGRSRVDLGRGAAAGGRALRPPLPAPPGKADLGQAGRHHRSLGRAAPHRGHHLRHPVHHFGSRPGVAGATSRSISLAPRSPPTRSSPTGSCSSWSSSASPSPRFTDVGLRVRAMVDSEAMASLSGTNPGRVAVGVWAFTATLAGLAGILVAPSQGLTTAGMTTLMAAAFAAVVVARLHSLAGAVIASHWPWAS